MQLRLRRLDELWRGRRPDERQHLQPHSFQSQANRCSHNQPPLVEVQISSVFVLWMWQSVHTAYLPRNFTVPGHASLGGSGPRLAVRALAKEADGAIRRARNDAHPRTLAREVHQIQELVPDLALPQADH